MLLAARNLAEGHLMLLVQQQLLGILHELRLLLFHCLLLLCDVLYKQQMHSATISMRGCAAT